MKHEKMRAGLSVQPGKAKKDNDKVSCFAQGGSGGTAGQKTKPYMKLIYEFARIAAFCFVGEVCHLVLPLPIPASVYGLMLLLAALRFGVVKLEQVRTAALFLTGIFPLLFVPAAAGVMDLWADLQAMLVPVLLALIPITILVMTVSGCVTQRLAERKEKKQ